jgi:hypothetical protein
MDSSVENNGKTAGGVTGRGFVEGQSGNPGGRPKGLARATRELVGDDGLKIAQFWHDTMRDENQAIRFDSKHPGCSQTVGGVRHWLRNLLQSPSHLGSTFRRLRNSIAKSNLTEELEARDRAVRNTREVTIQRGT